MKILVHFYFLFLLKLKTTLATHLSKFIFHENENESFLISQNMKIQTQPNSSFNFPKTENGKFSNSFFN